MSIVRRVIIDNELKRVARCPKREWFKGGGMSHYVPIDRILDQNRDVLEPGVVLIGFSRDSEYLVSYTLTPCAGTGGNDFYLEERNLCSVQIWKFSFHNPLYKVVDLPIGPIESSFDNIETVEAGPLFVVHCYDQVSEYHSHEMVSVFPSPLGQRTRSYSIRGAFLSFDLHSSSRDCGFPSSLVMQCTDIPGLIVINNGNTVSAWLFKSHEVPASKCVSVAKRVMTFVDVQDAVFSLTFKHFKDAYAKSVASFDSVFMCSAKGFFVIIHALVSVCEREVAFQRGSSCHEKGGDSELDALFYDDEKEGEEDGDEKMKSEGDLTEHEIFKDSFAHIRAVLFLDYAGIGTKIVSVSVQRDISSAVTMEKLVEADRKTASKVYTEHRKTHPWTSPFHCTNASVASGMESLPILSHPLLPTGLLGFQSTL